MTNTSAQESLSQWVEEQFALSKAKITEAQAIISQAKEDIAYLKRTAKLLESSAGTQENGRNASYESGQACPEPGRRDDAAEADTPEETVRRPKEILFPPYVNMSILDAIEAVLYQSEEPLSPSDLTKEIYDAQNETEFQRAKASLATELRRGAELGKWKNVARGLWQLTVSEVEPNDRAQDKPLVGGEESGNYDAEVFGELEATNV